MQEQINKIEILVAKIDQKLDHYKEEQDRQRTQIHSLNKKWWSSLGAAMLALGSFVKTYLFH